MGHPALPVGLHQLYGGAVSRAAAGYAQKLLALLLCGATFHSHKSSYCPYMVTHLTKWTSKEEVFFFFTSCCFCVCWFLFLFLFLFLFVFVFVCF